MLAADFMFDQAKGFCQATQVLANSVNVDQHGPAGVDVPAGVFTAEQVEALEAIPFDSAFSSKTLGPVQMFDGPPHAANVLTFVLDFKDVSQGSTFDIFNNEVTSFDFASYGFSAGNLNALTASILAEVEQDYFSELVGTVAGPPGQDLEIDFIIGDIGTPPVGLSEYYYIQIGTGIAGPHSGGTLGVAGGSVVRNSGGAGPNSGIQVGDVVGSVFTDAIVTLGGLTPSNALTSGNIAFSTFGIGGTLSHEIGHNLSLSHINKSGSVQPTAGRPPLMGTGAIDLPNGDRILDREFSLSGVDGENGSVARQHIQQLVNAVGLHATGGVASSLVGIDFDVTSGNSPVNWTRFSGGVSTATLTNVPDESGASTPFDLVITSNTGSPLVASGGAVNAGSIPIHTQALNGLDGFLASSNSSPTFQWTDLTPLATYEIFVFGLQSNVGANQVTIVGDGQPISFQQVMQNGNLHVNQASGTNNLGLNTFAQTVTAASNGTIAISVSALVTVSGTLSLGGLAIRPVGSPAVGTIRGTKWNDLNNNSAQDPGEPGLPGVTIYIDANTNGVFDNGELSTLTVADNPLTTIDETGRYEFVGVIPGTYAIREIVPAGFVQTSPVVPLVSGQAGTTQLILNGGFETNGLANWSVALSTTAGTWTANNGSFDPNGPGIPTPALVGSTDAVSNQTGPGVRRLSQTFTVPSEVQNATLSWVDRIENFATTFSDPNQEFRVRIADAFGTTITQVFSTNPGDALISGPNVRSFDISAALAPLAGQTIQLVFDQEDNLNFFNVHVDDVSLTVRNGANVLLISDTNELTGVAPALIADGHNVTEVTGEFAAGSPRLSDLNYLSQFDFVVWGASGAGFGSLHPPAAITTLENYLQSGGDLLVTGYDTLASPDDPALAQLVRSTTRVDIGSTSLTTENIEHFILNGPAGDFRGATIAPNYNDWDGATADTSQGTIALASQNGSAFDAIIYTGDIGPVANVQRGSVGYWTGGASGATASNGKTDWKTGTVIPESIGILRNWVFGVIGFTGNRTAGNGVWNVSVTAGETVSGVSFGNAVAAPGSISGTKWNDLNGDGIRNFGELGLANVTIYADLNDNRELDNGEPSVITSSDNPQTTGIDETGQYTLAGLTPGTQFIREIVPTGFVQTFPVDLGRLPSNGLIGLYDFENGTTANEIVGTSALPNLTASNVGISGGNAVFDAASDYLELPATFGNSPFTIYVDATYNPLTANGHLFSQMTPSGALADIDFVSYMVGTSLQNFFVNGEGILQSINNGTFDGLRHQVAMTFDGATLGNYFSGSLQTLPLTGTLPDIDASVLRFGARSIGDSAAALGSVHEIRIYDRVLTAAELNAIAGLPDTGSTSQYAPSPTTNDTAIYGETTNFYQPSYSDQPTFSDQLSDAPALGDVVEIFNADFTNPAGLASTDGFTIDNTGGAAAGLWHPSNGRGIQAGHSAQHSLYFGTGETISGGGTYNVGHTAGRVQSPTISLPVVASATLEFQYVLNVQNQGVFDNATVSISSGGGPFVQVASRGDGLTSGSNDWQSASIDLSRFVGNNIVIRFDFDTLNALANNFEGWYIDDVRVLVDDGSASIDGAHRLTLASGANVVGIDFGNRLLDVVAPTITGVFAAGSAWSPALVDAVDGGTIGTGNGLGYELAAGVILPNSGIDLIYVQFDEPILNFDTVALALLGSNVASFSNSIRTAYDSVNRRGVISISAGITNDKLRLGVNDSLTDRDGNELNVGAAAAFDLRFNILVGDADSSGSVNGGDLPIFATSFNTSAGASATYNPRADWDSSSSVNGGDLPLFGSQFNQSLPPAEPPQLNFDLPATTTQPAVDLYFGGYEDEEADESLSLVLDLDLLTSR